MCLSVFKCCKTENIFSYTIFIPHGLQNKMFPSVKNFYSPNSEINYCNRVANGVFSFGILKKKTIKNIVENTKIQKHAVVAVVY